jgi:TonB-dependent SusC/RagA subfamily outer membrane receptor
VVTGYQQLRKRDITGAVSVVKTEDLENLVTSSFAQKLQGRAAGVTMSTSGQVGDATNIRIRGISSFGQNNPLYIIDGVQMMDQGNLSINPSDIESIQVLKDAATAGIYGARSSNGVIVITTKKGKAGKTKFDYNGSYSMSNPTKGWDDILITDANEYLDMTKQFFKNGNQALPTYVQNDQLTKYIFPATNGDPGAYSRFSNPVMLTSSGTNWWEAITRTGAVQDHNLSVTGGNDKATFAISAGILDQQGYVKYNDFKRYCKSKQYFQCVQ